MVRLEEAGSTNDVAAALAARGWPEGTVVVAGSQRAGRGRQGRAWHSPPGANLYFSLVLRPPRPLREWPGLSWVVAAAVAEAVRPLAGAALALKHPNDVVASGRKLAGVLLETRTGAGEPAALVAGIGINVNVPAAAFPPALRETATSLLDLGGRVGDCAEVLAGVCGAIDRWYALWCAGGTAAALAQLAAAGLGAAPGGPATPGALDERDADPAGEGGERCF